jgi:formylmethanofuran dehydrogenase subunit D
MKKLLMRKAVIGGLALTMMVGGASAAFADNNKNNNNNKGHNQDWKKVFQRQTNNGNGNNKAPNANNKAPNTNTPVVNNLNVKNLTIKLSFNDIKGGDVEWAARYIASLASKKVFEGYEDGTFRPRQTITRIEAIAAAVKLMDLKDEAESNEAKQQNLNFKDADKIPAWAKGYVAVALENDLFEESADRVDPMKEADRLWVTTLLVKAMNKDDEAKNLMNTKLTFKDANQIPAGSVGYVAVAIKDGMIDGYEDNTFRPNRPVTRAEATKLIAKTGEQLPNDANYNFKGTLTADVSGNMLYVRENGNDYSIPIASDAQIYRNEVKVSASALRSGDSVRIGVADEQVVFVDAYGNGENNQTQLPQNSTFSATLESDVSSNTIDIYYNGRTYYDVVLLSGADIELSNGTNISKSDLRDGDRVTVITRDGKIEKIIVTDSINGQLPQDSTFEATVNSEVVSNRLSLIKDGRTYNNVEIVNNADIELSNGTDISKYDLRVGDRVTVTTDDGRIERIIVTNAVSSQLPQNSTFTATVNSDDVEILSNAIIKRADVNVSESSLRAGDEVRVTTENGKIKEVVVTNIVSARFNNYDVYASGDMYRINVDLYLSSGTVQENVYYNTVPNVEIQGGSRSDLTVDRAIELRLGSDNIVNKITIK